MLRRYPAWKALSRKHRKVSNLLNRYLFLQSWLGEEKFDYLQLLVLHGILAIIILASLPPAHEVPKITIPILWAGSFCAAYVGNAVISIIYHRLVDRWMKQ